MNQDITSLIAENERLEQKLRLIAEVRDQLSTQLRACERDAGRYRWLRECSGFRSDRGAVTVNWPAYDNGRLVDGDRWLSFEDLDAAIDAAITPTPGKE